LGLIRVGTFNLPDTFNEELQSRIYKTPVEARATHGSGKRDIPYLADQTSRERSGGA
jgi:hypothetical protein